MFLPKNNLEDQPTSSINSWGIKTSSSCLSSTFGDAKFAYPLEREGFSANLCRFFPQQSATEEFPRDFGHLSKSFSLAYAPKLKCNKYAIETERVQSFLPRKLCLVWPHWAWPRGRALASIFEPVGLFGFPILPTHLSPGNFSALDLRFNIHFSGFFQGRPEYIPLSIQHQSAFSLEAEISTRFPREIFNDDRKMILSRSWWFLASQSSF